MGERIYINIYLCELLYNISVGCRYNVYFLSIGQNCHYDVYVHFELVFERFCPSLIELVFISIKGCCLYHLVASILNDHMMNITLPYNHCVIFRTPQTLTNCSMCLDLNYRNSHKIKVCSI